MIAASVMPRVHLEAASDKELCHVKCNAVPRVYVAYSVVLKMICMAS